MLLDALSKEKLALAVFANVVLSSPARMNQLVHFAMLLVEFANVQRRKMLVPVERFAYRERVVCKFSTIVILFCLRYFVSIIVIVCKFID